MNDAADKFDDELLSAYVDGELTGEQLALIEQRLTEDPAARQLVDELRSLGQELRSLPKETAGEDLRAKIMQRAERSMLLGSEEQPVLRSNENSSSRRWVWAAAAIAAALMLMFVTPEEDLQLRPVAKVNPIPGERPRGEMRMEAVEPAAPLADADEALKDTIATPAEPLIGGRGGELGVAVASSSRAAMSPPVAAREEVGEEQIDPAFQVHITLNQGANNLANFNRMLVSNGIELEAAEDEGNTDLRAAAEVPAARTLEAAEAPRDRDSEMNLPRIQEEVLLVEAPAENIENVLAACSLDLLTCASVRVETEAEKSAELPIENISQYSRSGRQLNQQQNKLKREQQTPGQVKQGKAMWLKSDQYQFEPDGQLNLGRKQSAKGKLLAKQSRQDPVQVLFILQQDLGDPDSVGGAAAESSDR